MSKIKIRLDDPETRAVWEAALRAKREVASWPAWKRGDDVPTKGTSVSETVTCQHCHVSFKRPHLYEEHLRADKSCPWADAPVEVHHLNLIGPRHEGQKRIVQLNTTIPIRVEMIAVWHGGALMWSTVSIISDASFPTEKA